MAGNNSISCGAPKYSESQLKDLLELSTNLKSVKSLTNLYESKFTLPSTNTQTNLNANLSTTTTLTAPSTNNANSVKSTSDNNNNSSLNINNVGSNIIKVTNASTVNQPNSGLSKKILNYIKFLNTIFFKWPNINFESFTEGFSLSFD
jgi:hypothetical protein